MADRYQAEDLAEIAPFAKAYRCFLFDKRLKPAAKVLYLILKAHCIGTDETFVSIATLANETGFHVNTVGRNLKCLVDAGFIREESRGALRSTTKTLAGLSNLYTREQVIARLGATKHVEPSTENGGTKNSEPTKNGGSPSTENGGSNPPKTVDIHRRRDVEESKEKKGEAAAFVKLWNASGLRKCIAFSSSRANALRTRLKDSFWKQNYQAALKRASGIPGLSGANGRNWRADIDWFLGPDNVAKLMEGKYDGWNDSADGKRIKPQSKPQTSKWDDPKWHARQAKIHDLHARKKREAKEKDKPEPKPPQGYDPKWKPKVVEDSVDEDGKLPF